MRKKFEGIIGYDDIKRELEIICDMLENTDEYNKFGVHIKEGLILDGPPGTGKSTMAKTLMDETGRSQYICRKDAADGDFIKKLNNVFKEAKENAPAIILLDDMDKFTEKRGDDAEQAEGYVAVQSCIDDAKEYDIFVIGTVNDIDNLPDSLLRSGRLGNHIYVPYPDPNDADQIVNHYLQKYELSDDVHPLSISHMLYGKSCASLENVVNKAAIATAFNREKKISMLRLVDACLDVLYEAPKSTKAIDKKVIERVAYHEAGHALASELLEPGSVTVVSVRSSYGSKHGFVRYNRPEDKGYSKERIDKDIKTSLAGKAASEVVFGEIDTGASSDLSNAFYEVRKLLDDLCGMGFDSKVPRWHGEGVFAPDNKNRKAAYMIEQYYSDVKKILIDNRSKLDALARALIAKETLTYIDVQQIMNDTCVDVLEGGSYE